MGCHVTFCDVNRHSGRLNPIFLHIARNNGSKNPGISSQISEKVLELGQFPDFFGSGMTKQDFGSQPNLKTQTTENIWKLYLPFYLPMTTSWKRHQLNWKWCTKMEQQAIDNRDHLNKTTALHGTILQGAQPTTSSITKHTTINNMPTSNDENDDDNDAAFWNAAATFLNYFELFKENNVLKLIGVLDNNNKGNKPKWQRRTKSVYNRADQKRSLFYTEYLEPYDEKDEDEDIPLLHPTSKKGKRFATCFVCHTQCFSILLRSLNVMMGMYMLVAVEE